jgi:hypothetical protein
VVPPARLELSAPVPSPFSSRTRFELALPGAAHVEVIAYDLRGRAVAVLHRGVLGPGVADVTWDGARADGTPAANGVYFVRATSAFGEATRKVALMRAR